MDKLEGQTRGIEVAQAWAWLKLTRPDDYNRWDRLLDDADYREDWETYNHLEHDMVQQWRGRRDDLLPEPDRRAAELAQAQAWLGLTLSIAWKIAHGLAINTIEQERDQHSLIEMWKRHGAHDPEASGVRETIAAVRKDRERRLANAATWFYNNNPAEYEQWWLRSGFADSIAESGAEDRKLIQKWLDLSGGAIEPRRSQEKRRRFGAVLGRAPQMRSRNGPVIEL